jgi:hypothetical protein
MSTDEMIAARKDVDVKTLPITGELHDWSVAPWGAREVVWGSIYNDVNRRFPDGKSIHTSAVVKIEDGVVVTLNSAYRLVGEGYKASA